jgi:hypothetical protein
LRYVAPLATLLLLPLALDAQDDLPPRLAEVENARSRACVESLARLAELDASLEPYARRLQRLNTLGLAVSLENRDEAAPFDRTDSLEDAVARWFSADSALAVRYVAEPGDALREERNQARTAMLDRIRTTMQELSSQAQERARAGADIEAAAQPCLGAVLVRSAVLEVCSTSSNPVCDAARASEPQNRYRFVEDAADIWDVEEYGPWTQPGPIQLTPDGELTGARTSARARRGNVLLHVSVAPLILAREELEEEQVADYQANLDSLGFTFEHPLLVMAPAMELQVSLPPPVGGETHYLLHFGDLSGDDVIWSAEAGAGGLLQVLLPASGTDLQRLRAGEQVSLTALRIPEGDDAEADLVFSLALLQINQDVNVANLLAYMAEGGLSNDLITLIPPPPGGGGAG